MRFNRQARELRADRVRRACEAVQPVSGIDAVIAGHTVLVPALPRAIANLLFIDTGAQTEHGRLTLVDPLNRRYWQVGRSRSGLRGLRKDGQPSPSPLSIPPQGIASHLLLNSARNNPPSESRRYSRMKKGMR